MKTKTKFLATLLALSLFLLSLLGLGGVLTAHALSGPYEDYEFPGYDPGFTANPDENLTSLYYFSDYAGSRQYFNGGFVGEYLGENPNITDSALYCWETDFWENFMLRYSNELCNIQNAIIIFEVRSSLPFEYGVFNGKEQEWEKYEKFEGTEYEALKNVFSLWQDSGCKIMLINGTDEVWFETYGDEFLDFVDIHINIDLMTTFTYSTVCDMIENHGIYGAAIIFDSFSSQDWFFRGFFLPYVVSVMYKKGEDVSKLPHITEYSDYFDVNNADAIVTELKLKVSFYDNETDSYTDMFGVFKSAEEVMNEFNGGNFSYIIGGTQSIKNETFLEIGKQYGNSAFYAYNDLWQTFDQIPEGINYFGMGTADLDYYLSPIMRDFILNDKDSLQKYDNYDGHCAVTFRPVFRGEGGWARTPEKFEIPNI